MIDFASTCRIALLSLKTNKMRSILTSLGIIIGVSAVIIMLSIGAGASKRISEQISSMGSNLIMIFSSSSTSGGIRMGAGTQPSLTLKDAQAIKEHCPAVAEVASYVREAKQVTFSNQNWSTEIGGTTGGYLTVRDWELLSGRNFTEDDVKNASKVAILGNTVIINLFGDLEPVGKVIRIGGVPFKVIGTLKKKGEAAMGQDQDDLVLIPVSTGQKKLFGMSFPGLVRNINVKAVSVDALPLAETQINTLLRMRHRIGRNDEDDFTVRNMTQMLESAKQATNVMAMLLGSIASVSLLVGGIGIMNIMLVSVTERTKEIGIRMAIGAKSSDIRKQFLIEALILSFAGGLIGVIIGIAGTKLVELIADIPGVITPLSVFLSLGFSAFIGVVFGYYPAYKASLLNPIDALRYE